MKSIRSATKHKTSTGLAPELKNRVNKLLGYTSLIILFAYIVFGQSELLFLKHMGAASDLAFFSVGFVLARSASALIPGVYNNILLSRISFAVGKDENEATTAFLTASRHMLILGLLCAIPLAVFAEDIVLFLYGDAYQPAYLPTFVFSLVAVLAVIRDTTNAYLVSNDRQPLILRIVFILFCATIILDYFLILELGLLGAVIAYAVIETMAAAVLSFYAFRMLGHWPDMGKILRTIVAAAATALIACILAALLNFPGGFIIGGALCPVVFIISLALFDAFEDEDYRAVQPFVAERSDRLSRMLASTIHARLETSSRSIKRQG